jgi:tripartite-type tricarboxylate transporter receptor subunit TctC
LSRPPGIWRRRTDINTMQGSTCHCGAYAVTAEKRVASAPEIPTANEAGLPDFHMSVWNAIWVPKGTPKEIVTKLNAAVKEALAVPRAKAS